MNKTILVVEDEGILALILQNLLINLGYDCAGPLTTGEEAIAYLANRQVDLILMDIELAGNLNGLETAKKIRGAFDIPIIFLTGFSRGTQFEEAKRASPHCLVKPVGEQELAAALRDALRERSPAPLATGPPLPLSPPKDDDPQLGDILDRQALQTMMEQYHRLTGIGIGILDRQGNVLVGVGWQDICTKFHRLHPETMKNCKEANHTRRNATGSRISHRCRNNLWDLSTPITIDGRQVGNVCLGQFFYDDELPDYDFFKNQAKKCGFDEAEYLAALDRVPRWSREKVAAALDFYESLAKMISTLSYSAMGLSRALVQKDAALRQLDESRHFQSSLLDSIPIPVYYKDMTGRYLGFNRAGEAFYRRTKAQMIGKTAFDLHPQPLAQLYHDRETELFSRKGAQVYETVFTLPQGDKRDVIVHEASLTDGYGTIIGVIGAMLDITERKQAERQLQENRKFLEATAMMTPDVVYLFDIQENRHIYINHELEDLLGYTNEEIRTAGADILLSAMHPKDLPQVQKHMARMASTMDDTQHEVEYRIRNRHAAYQWFYVRERVYLRDDMQRPKILFGIVQDISERKKAEEEKKLLQAQLIQAQKMEAIGTLAGGIAHDFNNILGAILGYAEMVREDSLPESNASRDLDQIILAANRARDLVKQILAFSRQADTTKVPVQPASLVRETMKLLRSSLPATIAIQQDIDPQTASIFADPSQIHQILMNICTNAFHAMEEHGGTLGITLGNLDLTRQALAGRPQVQPGRFVRLSVRDTGPGILPEIKDRIFDPYFTTKEQGKGTGLGLAIAHGIAKGHGGFVTCESQPGDGTVFHVFLPALSENMVTEHAVSTHIPGGSEHILFIDDEIMLAEMAQVMLERLGYTVTIQSDSLEAMAIFASRPKSYDLVISDQTMPGMTGLELAQRMLQIRSDIPIILCTGYSNLVSEEKARSIGIKGFALKPLAKKEIAVLIRKVLEAPPATILPPAL